jgi:thiamine biosynthesis lipoprotein
MDAKPTANRREFLTGQSAARAVQNAAQRAAGVEDEQEGEPSAEPYLVRMARSAMACQFEVYFNAGQYPQATEIALAAFDLIDELEAQLTIHRDSSELMHVNRTAAEESVVVEPRLFRLLERAVELHRETRGAFDVTSGPLSKVWGFYRRAGAVPSEEDRQAALARVGSQLLELDCEQGSVRFQQSGMELNLGSIGKGYALDRCDELLAEAGVRDFLWHGGQSSVLARGHAATNGRGETGWSVGVRHPMGGDRRLAEIRLHDQALATSGSSVQFFRHKGKRYGHILDPRTGMPAEGVFSATVVAQSAALADALSTAFYVLGVEGALDFCQRHPEVGMLLLYPSRSGSAVEMATAGLAPGQLRLLSEVSA